MMYKEGGGCTRELTPVEVKFAKKFRDVLQVDIKLFMKRKNAASEHLK